MTRSQKIWLIIGAVFSLMGLGSYFVYTHLVVPFAIGVQTGFDEAVNTQKAINEGPAMRPTLTPGQRVTYRKYTKTTRIRRGDVIVFTDPKTPRRTLIRRVIAVGGDTISIQQGATNLNGRTVRELYLLNDPGPDLPERTISAGSVWVMGDNRDYSLDSRHFGELSRGLIKGIVKDMPPAWLPLD